ncbi:Aa-trans domain-containing protein [Mycena indigotica]|uniref:Aa-trans domain-containing protein n=1 Tax=Mycena indigotica TaxID=2126181 RepID=A0A8H6TF72_9AGAR|nr:Aa-trans domain-containing protein [Mycena indigotica]KAF7315652.1 Aa-trans domain-containing protein [Mycena indigotica]
MIGWTTHSHIKLPEIFSLLDAFMFSQPNREAAQPLLQDDDNTIFALDSDEEEESALNTPRRNVRFQEEVQVIAPAAEVLDVEQRNGCLIASEFDQDTDELDEDSQSQVRAGSRNQSMPLLVGLFDASHSRGVDVSVPLLHVNGTNGSSGPDVDLEALAAKRVAGGGLIDSIANMANSILGAGIIGLPYAVSQAGFFTGLFLLVVLCGITDWTIRLIVINAKMSGTHSYIGIMNHCFGASGRASVSFFQFAFAFGGMCAFGIIIGDTIPHVIRSIFPQLYQVPVLSLFTNRKFVISLCTICISYPLSLYRDIHKLSRASGLALIGMLIIVTSVMIESPQTAPELKGDPSKRFSFIEPGVFQAIGVISFAFVCHHNSLLIYGSLRTPTLDRFAFVTHISTLLSLIACCTLAISGYVVFTDKTQGNILNNFAPDDTLINVARFCFGLNMFTTLPLELFVCREVIEQYFFSHETFKMERHVFFTTTILFASMFVSLITCDLGVMLEITGGVAASALAFIFPASCFIKLADKNAPWHSRAKLPAYICAVFGVLVMTISLYLALAKSWTPEGSAKICM